jgi:hypothetical protein
MYCLRSWISYLLQLNENSISKSHSIRLNRSKKHFRRFLRSHHEELVKLKLPIAADA